MFCQNCGHELPEEVKFCGQCGTEVVRVAVAEKPVTFEEFMASRGGGASRVSEPALSVQFKAAQRAKKKERSAHFKAKGDKKKDETVKVGLWKLILLFSPTSRRHSMWLPLYLSSKVA